MGILRIYPGFGHRGEFKGRLKVKGAGSDTLSNGCEEFFSVFDYFESWNVHGDFDKAWNVHGSKFRVRKRS